MVEPIDRKYIHSPEDIFLSLSILAWIIINLIQAAFTELWHDEAYYWVWSKSLAWGYFDHPPMIALWIYLGRIIAGGELGVRLVTVLMSGVSVILLWRLVSTEHRQATRFMLLVAGALFLHVYGFIATPDAPLMLFAVLYLWQYRRFLQRPALNSSLWWGLSMAMLMYSKYHGLLLIGFSVLGHIRLIKNPWFYVAAGTGLMLYSPHLWWQYEHGFPSLQYHLVERASQGINPAKVLANLLNPFYIIGPLVVYFFIAVIRRVAGNPFERSLKWVFWGMLIFFTVTSLTYKDSVYANWLVLMIIPGVYFTYQWWNEQPERRKGLKWVAITSVCFFMLARILLVLPVLPRQVEFQGNKIWTAYIQQRAGTRQVIFENSYALASKYWFYTGDSAFTQCNARYRLSQFDLSGQEEFYQHQPVFFIGDNYLDTVEGFRGEALPTGKKDSMWTKNYTDYTSANRLLLTLKHEHQMGAAGQRIHADGELYNPYARNVLFRRTEVSKNIYLQIFRGKQLVFTRPVDHDAPDSLLAGETRPVHFSWDAPQETGNYRVRFVLRHDGVEGTVLSGLYAVEIKN